MNNKALLFALLLALSGVDSFTIHCRFGTEALLAVGTVYVCATEHLPAAPSDITITAVTGTHQAGKTDADVTSFHINGTNTLAFVPRTSTVFPNLVVYRILFAAIDTLHGDEFNDMPQLQYLEFLISNLTTISSRLFEATPGMAVVAFAGSPLKRVGHDLFTPLNTTQLRYVGFLNNHCIQQSSFDPTAIAGIIEDLRVLCPFDDKEVATRKEKN
jgi:hypothetical protein